MASDTIQTPALTWQGVDLPRVPPGNYGAACVGWQGPEWVRSIRRWSLRLEFSLLSEDVSYRLSTILAAICRNPL